jgi:hypothetical protein
MVQQARSDGPVKNILIALIVIGIIIECGIGMIDLFQTQNSDFIEPNQYRTFNESFNKRQQALNKVEELNAKLGGQKESGIVGLFNAIYNSAVGAIFSLSSGFAIVNDLFNGLSTNFGIPSWVSISITGLITVSIVFSLLSVFFYKEI